MGIRGGSVLVPWRPAFWNAAEVVYDVAWVRPSGMRRLIAAGSLMAWSFSTWLPPWLAKADFR